MCLIFRTYDLRPFGLNDGREISGGGGDSGATTS